MSKKSFIIRVTVYSLLLFIAFTLAFGLWLKLYDMYELPNENNTSIIQGTVTDVHRKGKKGVFIEMANEDEMQLTYPFGAGGLYSEIGYDANELKSLLVGKEIQCVKMNKLSFILEIHVDDDIIDNSRLTVKQIKYTRMGITILCSIMIVISIAMYLTYTYDSFKKFKKSNKKLKVKTQLVKKFGKGK